MGSLLRLEDLNERLLWNVDLPDPFHALLRRSEKQLLDLSPRHAQKPKSAGTSPDWRMIERVVPIGTSFRGCGTIATRPEALRNLQ